MASAPAPGLERVEGWAVRHRWWLFGGLGLLHLAAYGTRWRISPDSADYLIIARNIAEGAGFTHPRGFEEIVAPGYPHLLAGVMTVFGTDAIWAVNLVMMLLGFASLALVYWLFHLHAGRGAAVMTTVILGITETYFIARSEPMADLPFMTGMLLLLIGLERFYTRRPVWLVSGLLMLGGIALMGVMRNVVLTAMAALVLGLGWEALRRRKFGVLAAAVGVAIAGVLAVRLANPNLESIFDLSSDERLLIHLLTTELPGTVRKALTTNLYLLFCETSSRAALGVDAGPWVNLPFGIAFLGAGLVMFRRRPVWGMLVIVFVPQWLIFYITRRYFLPLMPVLVFASWFLLKSGDRRFHGRWPSVVCVTLACVWGATNLVRVGSFIVEQHRAAFYEVYERGRFVALDVMAEYLRDETATDAVVLADLWYVGPLNFWSRRTHTHYWGDPRLDTGPAYTIEPFPDDLDALLSGRGWSREEPVAEIERPGQRPPLVLRPINRDEAPSTPSARGGSGSGSAPASAAVARAGPATGAASR
ncbi:MAG: glycosyltransferase family 39 protein [Planctomycetes bacterium]|nr:glycosyltransferase family 39 protein [Planctomycetota bacterium]